MRTAANFIRLVGFVLWAFTAAAFFTLILGHPVERQLESSSKPNGLWRARAVGGNYHRKNGAVRRLFFAPKNPTGES